FKEQVVAYGFEARFVGEDRQLDLADVGERRLALDLDQHLARFVDGDVNRVGGDGDARLQQVAFGGDKLAVFVHLERSVAGISRFARGQVDLEVPHARDGDVELVARHLQGPLFVDAVNGTRLDAKTLLDARGHDVAGVRG